jgi:hypothetical protein
MSLCIQGQRQPYLKGVRPPNLRRTFAEPSPNLHQTFAEQPTPAACSLLGLHPWRFFNCVDPDVSSAVWILMFHLCGSWTLSCLSCYPCLTLHQSADPSIPCLAGYQPTDPKRRYPSPPRQSRRVSPRGLAIVISSRLTVFGSQLHPNKQQCWRLHTSAPLSARWPSSHF